jgi:hypothetical protein
MKNFRAPSRSVPRSAHHLKQSLEELRLNEVGTYCINRNAELTQLQRETARESDDSVLRRRVCRHARAAAFDAPLQLISLALPLCICGGKENVRRVDGVV